MATHYFYWYRWPNEHFKIPNDPASEGHYHHFVTPEKVSYLSEDWHAGELWMMKAAGIDVALPVYWGAPGAYTKGDIGFSVTGLGPMVKAAQRLGDRSPKLGLFYDTSTLLNDVRGMPPAGGRADLTTPAGKDLFAQTIVEYFERVPRRLWATMDGRALVVLYTSAFAAKWDEGLADYTRKAFAKRFPGESVFLVADVTWGKMGQDRTTEWGSTITGAKLFPGVAQIGPGYNDSPVPGRTTPFREREYGNYYRRSWQKAIEHNPELVLLETWNEMHEGTEICQTEELGLKYVELSAEWIGRLRQGRPIGKPIKLKYPKPRFFKDLKWGKEALGRSRLFVDYLSGRRVGIRETALADGHVRVGNGRLISAPRKGGMARYVYFQVSDHWLFDVPSARRQMVKVRVELAEPAQINLEYDSHDANATMGGAYKHVAGRGSAELHEFELPGVLFGNRQNGASDFRLVVQGGTVAIRRVEVSR